MKIIVYAGAELLTGDEIAAGVLQYCAALAGSVVAEVIEIPVRERDGSLSRTTLLVGPTSQMIVKEAQSGWEEVVDEAVMRQLTERTRAQQPVADIHHPITDGDYNAATSQDPERWQSEY